LLSKGKLSPSQSTSRVAAGDCKGKEWWRERNKEPYHRKQDMKLRSRDKPPQICRIGGVQRDDVTRNVPSRDPKNICPAIAIREGKLSKTKCRERLVSMCCL